MSASSWRIPRAAVSENSAILPWKGRGHRVRCECIDRTKACSLIRVSRYQTAQFAPAARLRPGAVAPVGPAASEAHEHASHAPGQALSAAPCVTQRRDARLSALHRGDLRPGAALPSPESSSGTGAASSSQPGRTAWRAVPRASCRIIRQNRNNLDLNDLNRVQGRSRFESDYYARRNCYNSGRHIKPITKLYDAI